MPVIALFGGLHCSTEEVARRVAEALDLPCRSEQLLEQAAARSGIDAARLGRAMTGASSFFNNITHEREKSLAQLKLAVAHELRSDSFVFVGPPIHLIPKGVTHVLRVCIVADLAYRVARAGEQGLRPDEAVRRIQEADAELAGWTHHLFKRGPWDASLYDLKIPIHSTSLEGAVELILVNTAKEALKPTRGSLQAAMDHLLAAQVHLALVEAGHHYCDATASSGKVVVIINKNVLRLERLTRELERIAGAVKGAAQVSVKVGPGYNRPDIVSGQELPASPRYLLVDDEREFALTLSERLELRDFKSEVVYGGAEALAFVERSEPDVMVLDLRMPGMGGMDVLRRIKREHPRVEVIILTGHGSKTDEQTALEEGAFAYLQKPVDINVLAGVMHEAELKARAAATPAPVGPVGETGEPGEPGETGEAGETGETGSAAGPAAGDAGSDREPGR